MLLQFVIPHSKPVENGMTYKLVFVTDNVTGVDVAAKLQNVLKDFHVEKNFLYDFNFFSDFLFSMLK